METIKLGSGVQYELVPGGITENGNDKIQIVIIPGIMNFSEIEADFENGTNTQRIEILDNTGDIMDVKKGYTQLESIKKQKEYVIGREEIRTEITETDPGVVSPVSGESVEDGTVEPAYEVTYKDIIGTAYILVMSKPDLRNQVNSLQETVDMLVLSELGV